MKTYVCPAVVCLSVMVAAFCGAADVMPGPLHCQMLQSAAVTKLEQRIEIAAQGFSILPPQGERWCYRLLTSYGVSFFKIPPIAAPFDRAPSLEEFVAARLFSATAMSLDGLRDFEAQIQSADELKSIVDLLIHEQLFPQLTTGLASIDHRFRLLESNLTTVSYSNAMCVRFDAKVEERGNVQAPTLVFVLNYRANVVCRHPAVAESKLIWIGFVERYLRSEQPMAEALTREYEPYVQSLQFMPPRWQDNAGK
jgi:hypothetical protein